MLLREAILAQGFSFGTSKISVPYTFFNDLGLVEGFELAPKTGTGALFTAPGWELHLMPLLKSH